MVKLDEQWFRQWHDGLSEIRNRPEAARDWVNQHCTESFERTLNGKQDDKAALIEHLSNFGLSDMALDQVVDFVAVDHKLSCRAHYNASVQGKAIRSESYMCWIVAEDGRLQRQVELARMIDPNEPVWRLPERNWDASVQDKTANWTADSIAAQIQALHSQRAEEVDAYMAKTVEPDLVARRGDLVVGYDQMAMMFKKMASNGVKVTVKSSGWCVQSGSRVTTRIYITAGEVEEEQVRDIIYNPETGRLALMTMHARPLEKGERHFMMA